MTGPGALSFAPLFQPTSLGPQVLIKLRDPVLYLAQYRLCRIDPSMTAALVPLRIGSHSMPLISRMSKVTLALEHVLQQLTTRFPNQYSTYCYTPTILHTTGTNSCQFGLA